MANTLHPNDTLLLTNDLLALIDDTPRLSTAIIECLRHGWDHQCKPLPSGQRWRIGATGVRLMDIEAIIDDLGGYIRGCQYGAGWATWVSSSPFDQAPNPRAAYRNAKPHAVTPCSF